MISKLFHKKDMSGKKKMKEFLYINVGIFLSAAGIHFFRSPNNFALGGVSGIALLLTSLFPVLSSGAIMIILNGLLLVTAFLLLGKEFTSRSLYGSFAVSGMIWLLEILVPMPKPFTNQGFMELLYSVFIPGVGSALVFNYGATTGGTDIIAKLLSKYFRMKISVSLLITDFIIALCAGFIFGIEACLFSVMGVFLKSFIIDAILESMQIHKIVVIISKETEKIKSFITHELGRGATIHKSTGAYTIEEKDVITTVLNRRQAILLQLYIKQVDPNAFVTITNSSKILGKGFQSFE